MARDSCSVSGRLCNWVAMSKQRTDSYACWQVVLRRGHSTMVSQFTLGGCEGCTCVGTPKCTKLFSHCAGHEVSSYLYIHTHELKSLQCLWTLTEADFNSYNYEFQDFMIRIVVNHHPKNCLPGFGRLPNVDLDSILDSLCIARSYWKAVDILSPHGQCIVFPFLDQCKLQETTNQNQ